MNGLHSLGLKGEDMSKFLKLSTRSWDHTYALDIRHSSIMVSAPVISHFKTPIQYTNAYIWNLERW